MMLVKAAGRCMPDIQVQVEDRIESLRRGIFRAVSNPIGKAVNLNVKSLRPTLSVSPAPHTAKVSVSIERFSVSRCSQY